MELFWTIQEKYAARNVYILGGTGEGTVPILSMERDWNVGMQSISDANKLGYSQARFSKCQASFVQCSTNLFSSAEYSLG